ncbi:hypothetical protein SK128_003489 [Halocaridina rubra]|uniref:Anti-lipopolysaccharide factor n=1 Tax=Halocaridina rubra TaxID=373956 RepID=A0AAN9A973_HALRR
MMQSKIFLSLLVIGVLGGICVLPCQANIWEGLGSALAGQLGGLWEQSEMELLGNYCQYRVRPTIKRWELYFIASVLCPGWTPIRGSAQGRSRTGVVGEATRDFIRKALASGLITQEEASTWLSK